MRSLPDRLSAVLAVIPEFVPRDVSPAELFRLRVTLRSFGSDSTAASTPEIARRLEEAAERELSAWKDADWYERAMNEWNRT